MFGGSVESSNVALQNTETCDDVKGVAWLYLVHEYHDHRTQSSYSSRPLHFFHLLLVCVMKDDAKLQIKIKIPPLYPLKNVEVETVTRYGVSEAKWKRWVFQIIRLLSVQDGTIIDGVLLWKRNMENELNGVEACPICYSTLHPKFMCLPTLGCPTCRYVNRSGSDRAGAPYHALIIFTYLHTNMLKNFQTHIYKLAVTNFTRSA